MRRRTVRTIERAATWAVLAVAAVVLGGLAWELTDHWRGADPPPAIVPPPPAPEAPRHEVSAEATHWLNTATGTRHRRGCRYFGRTKQGRPCEPDEGAACGLCGG